MFASAGILAGAVILEDLVCTEHPRVNGDLVKSTGIVTDHCAPAGRGIARRQPNGERAMSRHDPVGRVQRSRGGRTLSVNAIPVDVDAGWWIAVHVSWFVHRHDVDPLA